LAKSLTLFLVFFQLFTQISFILHPVLIIREVTMTQSVKEKIKSELQQARSASQLRAEHIREIVRAAVAQVAAELKVGTSEVRTSVKEAIAAVVETLPDTHEQQDVQDDVTASIEGALEGLNQSRHQTISTTEADVKRLQEQLNQEQDALQQDVEHVMTEVETMGQQGPDRINKAIQAALQSVRDSEEVDALKQRYAQLQAQAAIIKANLVERYGGRSEEVLSHLEDAKKWYGQTRQKVKSASEQLEQKQIRLEGKMGEAGTAAAKGERRLRSILSELLQIAVETLQHRSSGDSHTHS
jgi:hypothetical protein